MYRHVHPQSFEQAWSKFKSGQSSDRLTLATACVIMALAIRYIPSRHALIASLPSQHDELCARYYAIARDALGRYRQECRLLSLELVEHLLVRTHYLTLSKNEAEEIWAIRGELVSIGTAMGLHRDPDKWKMPRDLAERRRWAWWHIILLERLVAPMHLSNLFTKVQPTLFSSFVPQMAMFSIWSPALRRLPSLRHSHALTH